MRRAAWIGALVISASALAYGALDEGGPRTDADRTYALADRIACPQCAGQSVAESDVTIARTIRADIARRVDEGQSDGEIIASLEAAYGEQVNLTPSASGLTGLVWVLPVVVVVFGAGLLFLTFRRWQRRPARAPTRAERELVEDLRRSLR